jgi:hypothetical protein
MPQGSGLEEALQVVSAAYSPTKTDLKRMLSYHLPEPLYLPGTQPFLPSDRGRGRGKGRGKENSRSNPTIV